MVTKKVNCSNDEPIKTEFQNPSEGQHCFKVVEVFDSGSLKFKLDDETVMVKLVVCEGDEKGRNIFHRLSLNSEWSGFFMTRLFLKAIGQNYKGNIEINTSNWKDKKFFGTVIHNPSKDGKKIYANINDYNFEKTFAEIKQELSPEEEWDKNL